MNKSAINIQIKDRLFTIESGPEAADFTRRFLKPFIIGESSNISAKVLITQLSKRPPQKNGNEWIVENNLIFYKHTAFSLAFDTAKNDIEATLYGDDLKIDSLRFALNAAFKIITEYYFPTGFFIHASSIEVNGCGIVFAGDSGQGKSTLAKMFDETRVISDEAAFIINEGSQFFLVPTPVRHDGNSLLASTLPLKLKAVCLIEHSDSNRLSELGNKELAAKAVRDLHMLFLPIPKLQKKKYGALLEAFSVVDARLLRFTKSNEIIGIIEEAFG